MYSAEFIFEPGRYDDQFYSLDRQIEEVAESLDGFLGRETWRSVDGKKVNAVYYWRDEKSLKVFSMHPKHLEPGLFTIPPTATLSGPASAAFRSVVHPHRTGEYASGALGRETPQLRHLTASRYAGMVNKAG